MLVSLDRSLDFAVTTAEKCRADLVRSRAAYFSSFWFGILVGILFSFTVAAVFHGLRALLTAPAQRGRGPGRASVVVEPATPARFRQRGQLH